MMLINLTVMIGFIWRIQENLEQQKVTINAVLNDYAALAAQQFSRSLKGQIGYAAMFELSQSWSGTADPVTVITTYMDQPQDQLTASKIRVRNSLTNIQVIDHTNNAITAISHPQLSSQTMAKIPEVQANNDFGITAIHDVNAQSLSFQSYIPINKQYSIMPRYSDDFVRESLLFLFQNRPMLPKVLTNNDNNLGLSISLKNPKGVSLWQAGEDIGAENQYTLSIDNDYGALFANHLLTVEINQKLVNQLVIGGLPQNQLPRLFWLVGLALFAMFIMFWLYRRTLLLTQLKEQFIARASHELKTPLTQIRLFAETMVLNRVKKPETAQHHIRIIHQESIRLSHLVENILNQHQINQASVVTHAEDVAVLSFIKDLVNQQKILWQDKSITLEWQVSAQDRISTDADLLRQILINLIDNAVKFGPEKQTITWIGEPQQESYKLSILDQGPGIPEQHIKRVMNAYERLSRDENRGINGNGLGLAIAQQLLEHLGGNLHFQTLEQGCKATITLPLTLSNKS